MNRGRMAIRGIDRVWTIKSRDAKDAGKSDPVRPVFGCIGG